MNLLQKLILIVSVFGAITIGYGMLPDGSAHPLPIEIRVGLQLVASYLGAMNMILPVDVLFQIVIWATVYRVARYLLWPIFLYVTNLISKLI